MHIEYPDIRRPLLGRTLRQTLLLTGMSVLTLSVSSFVVARYLLLERAQLHVATLSQATVDLVEQELRDMRSRAAAMAKDKAALAVADPAAVLRLDHPALEAVVTDAALQRETTLMPVIDRDGWQSVVVRVPSDGRTVVVTFSVRTLLERLAAAAAASGRTADILFGRAVEGELEILRVTDPAKRAALTLGTLQSQADMRLMIARATLGEHLRGMDNDYRGTDVLSAGQYLPSLGWGVTAQIDAAEVLEGVRLLAVLHALIGAAFLLLAAVGAAWLSRRLTDPIRSLARRVSVLGPGHWDLHATLHSEDEVAFLERVMADMASRLHDFTENLEKLVQHRTQALRRQYELDRTVLRAIEYGVLTVDVSGNVTGLNPAAETMLGVRSSDVLGTAAMQCFPLSSDGKSFLHDEHPLRIALTAQRVVHTAPGSSWTLAVPEKEVRSLSLVATPLKTGPDLFGAVIVFQDVTQERQMEQLKSEFITLASHQLRTPLSIMQWQLEAMHGETQVDPAQVTEMDNAAKRMTAIVNALLQVAKLEGGALEPVMADVDLARLLQNTAQETGCTAQRGVQVRVETAATLPCRTDAVLLTIVLQNLLENAMKYSKDGGTVVVGAAEAGGMCTVTVRDDGMGIPQNEQRNVFKKFFRGHNVRKNSTDGTGLGLYIAKMVTEQLGGTLTFESAEGAGTMFTLTLPKEPKTQAGETR